MQSNVSLFQQYSRISFCFLTHITHCTLHTSLLHLQSHAAPCLEARLKEWAICAVKINVSNIKISQCFWLRDRINIDLKWRLLYRFLSQITFCCNVESLKQSVPLCFCQMKNILQPAAWKLNPCFHVTVLLVLCWVNMTNVL